MLCRHMFLDINNMRIISLGIPKAMNIYDFATQYNIDINNTTNTTDTTNTTNNTINNATNNTTDDKKEEKIELDDSNKIKKNLYSVYKFPDGTMITYNPSLKKYNINNEINNENEEETKEVSENIEVIQNNIKEQFTTLFQFSTRKTVGTTSFNGSKTFLEMFNENNVLSNTDLNIIPDELTQNRVFVFNISHPDNIIISPVLKGLNTLCCVFQFKTELQTTEEFESIKNIEFTENNYQLITTSFIKLGNNMVTNIPLNDFINELQNININVNIILPEEVKFLQESTTIFHNTGDTITTNIVHNLVDVRQFGLQQLILDVNTYYKHVQGYVIYGVDGHRTKIINKHYKELKVLKGNKPIAINQKNIKNLFNNYWRLIKIQMLDQFINEFQDINSLSYKQLFFWFSNITRSYSINLFTTYHNSFVKKTMEKNDIIFSMKPLVGDLHNIYKLHRQPITPLVVEKYIFEQSADRIFWRLFS